MSKATQKVDDAHHTDAVERQHREAALDDTIEASFPASDPPSTDPNPDAHEPLDNEAAADEEPGLRELSGRRARGGERQ